MSKHTPGPWTLDRTPTYWAMKHPHTGRLLATVAHSTKANSDANARLIVAAPDLLLALRMLYDETEEYIRLNNLGGMDNQCMQLARAALARAVCAA